MISKDTIVAISTAAGVGAIGLVRLCGPEAVNIVDNIFKGKLLKKQASHTAHFGGIYDRNHKLSNAILVDEVVVTLFLGNRSFTGEDTVEISAHGSYYILQQILQSCIAQGARMAGPGEFTQRAFLNGKMDLAQAEAVGDLIASENKASHEIALNQMRGGVSSELAALREELINFTALIELELDFGEEDVEFADRSALKKLVEDIKSKVKNLIKSFEYGNALKNGVPVAIIGKPNAGKSTLLNALLKEERAIVSDIAGTTRDVIEEAINLDGITFRFIDTAGIRHTEDSIEAIGVERAKEKVTQAKVVIHLYETETDLLEELSESLKGKLVFNLKNKMDKYEVGNDYFKKLKEQYPDFHHFGLSVKQGLNVERLTQELVSYFQEHSHNQSIIITNIRHKEALEKALLALNNVEEGMNIGLTGDLLSLHLKDALYQLGTITGRIEIDKDILGTIFGKFCIGK
ncbi:MAG TPA: tRNA uridine-5-carboxymethylaminomethyl(34) synthesis GTPase MnmE [Edaphocola sp.]|nr:tRNA uridine-5-carboxymethylaminomethyl(34) synthesis GTPase MnmE [Edaphocola sp.]